jgi:hypothetical protein
MSISNQKTADCAFFTARFRIRDGGWDVAKTSKSKQNYLRQGVDETLALGCSQHGQSLVRVTGFDDNHLNIASRKINSISSYFATNA